VILCVVMVQDRGWYRPLLVTDSPETAQAQMQAWALTNPMQDAYIQPCQLNEPVIPDDAVWSVEGCA
jgi:hypothetical protein